eukprot:NODE_619_length_5923_cov_0.480769.p4 type:complete len:152 gc:universal NODE_619_length_5923_cov_0.480769:2197-2652(+)
MVLKLDTCAFSGNKIYPGRVRLFARIDNKTFKFGTSKSSSLFRQRKNPRKLDWTQLYRLANKKGVHEQVNKKRVRRKIAIERPIEGASLEAIKAKKKQTSEFRTAQRESALKEAKEKKKIAEKAKLAKKAEKAKTAEKSKSSTKKSSSKKK